MLIMSAAIGGWEIAMIVLIAISAILALVAIFKEGGFKKLVSYLQSAEVVRDKIEEYMMVAEEMKGLNGAEKKDFVINETMKFLETQGVHFPIQEINVIIEGIINLSKKINKRK